MTARSPAAPWSNDEPSVRTDILLTYAGIGLGLFGLIGAASALQRNDALTDTVILVAGPPAAVALLLSLPRRPRPLYLFRLGSALGGYLAAYLGLFAVNLYLSILVVLNPFFLVALIALGDAALIAFVMILAEHLRTKRAIARAN